MGLKITDLQVANYMTAYPVSVQPSVPFADAVNFMTSRCIGNLIVSEGKEPIGIFTEREILKHVVLGKAKSDVPVKDIGIQPFVKITPDIDILTAAKTMISKKSRLLVFVNGDKLVGIITASDMLRAFRKTDDAPPLDKVSSTKVYMCSKDDTILDAATLMYEKRIGSVIINEKLLYKIFTERDLLVHVLVNEVNLNGKVIDYASSPLIKANYGIVGNKAAGIMVANNIKRLPLTKDDQLAGMITARDLVEAFQSTYQLENPYLKESAKIT